ncbi:hypothetical protein [Nesterenkonia pannonica]|uniref:hypothetical protein n=1 Tax=Nesterenkonia pannonica TaxID=1548602 RepID=UPI002164E13B|nr:hypothetical protein [Nesterenkonia pannonica]
MRDQYYFKVGYFGLHDEAHEASIERFDEFVLSSRILRHDVQESPSRAGTLTLAVDVSDEKGTWTTLERDLPRVVRRLGEQLEREVEVLLDGWTLPHTPGTRDLRRVREEKKVADALRERLQEVAARVELLVGASPRDKIQRLAGADVFLSRYGTGSMFVSRMLRRPGVVHHSGLANYEDIHIQGPKVEVLVGEPDAKEPGKRVHTVSYDLSWEDVVERLLAVLR